MIGIPLEQPYVRWRKAKRSIGSGDNCVEVAQAHHVIAVRDSKNPDGPTLRFDRSAFRSFLGKIQVGDLDH
jgi:Domain of unknown function (DUF397)